jgi:hypothetical protein
MNKVKIFFREGAVSEGDRKFDYKLFFKLFKFILTDHPIKFRSDEHLRMHSTFGINVSYISIFYKTFIFPKNSGRGTYA